MYLPYLASVGGAKKFADFCGQSLVDSENHESCGDLPRFLRCAASIEQDSVHLENENHVRVLDEFEQTVMAQTLYRFQVEETEAQWDGININLFISKLSIYLFIYCFRFRFIYS
jgi:hypothetical protein